MNSGRTTVAQPRRPAPSRPQRPESASPGRHVRLHTDDRAAALGALAPARPHGQGRQHTAASGHHGEQVERHRVAAVHRLQAHLQLHDDERHRLCYPLQVPGGGHGNGDARHTLRGGDEHAVGKASVRYAGTDLVDAARLRGGAGQVHHAGQLQEGLEKLLRKYGFASGCIEVVIYPDLVAGIYWFPGGRRFQINYSFSCLQCPNMYAEVDEKTGDTIQITKPIPLPALNVSASMYCSRLRRYFLGGRKQTS